MSASAAQDQAATQEAGKTSGPPRAPSGTIASALAVETPLGEEFCNLVVEILGREGSHAADRIYLFDLGGIRHQLGDRWERFSDVVRKTAQDAILDALAERDFSRIFHDAYLLVFGDCPKIEREFKCTKIARQVGRTLFGEAGKVQDLALQRVSVGPDNDISLESIWDDAPLDRLVGSLTIEEALQSTDWSALENPVVGTGSDQIEFIYRPMWFTERKVVSNFMCVPALRVLGEELLVGDAVLPPSANPDAMKALDFLTLRRVVRDLSASKSAKQSFIIGYPLHYQTLVDESARDAYLALCRSVPESARKLSIVELVGLPQSFESRDLTALLAELRPYARAMLARLRIHHADFQGYKEAGIVAVGSDLSESSRSEAELIPLMETFAERANAAMLKTYVHGLRSISMTTAAVCAGFTYVDGDAVTSLTDMPAKSYPLSVEKLYAHLAPAPA